MKTILLLRESSAGHDEIPLPLDNTFPNVINNEIKEGRWVGLNYNDNSSVVLTKEVPKGEWKDVFGISESSSVPTPNPTSASESSPNTESSTGNEGEKKEGEKSWENVFGKDEKKKEVTGATSSGKIKGG